MWGPEQHAVHSIPGKGPVGEGRGWKRNAGGEGLKGGDTILSRTSRC